MLGLETTVRHSILQNFGNPKCDGCKDSNKNNLNRIREMDPNLSKDGAIHEGDNAINLEEDPSLIIDG